MPTYFVWFFVIFVNKQPTHAMFFNSAVYRTCGPGGGQGVGVLARSPNWTTDFGKSRSSSSFLAEHVFYRNLPFLKFDFRADVNLYVCKIVG